MIQTEPDDFPKEDVTKYVNELNNKFDTYSKKTYKNKMTSEQKLKKRLDNVRKLPANKKGLKNPTESDSPKQIKHRAVSSFRSKF